MLLTGIFSLYRDVMAPTEEYRLYPLIIGEHRTGKTSLIELALKRLKEPKDVVYVNVPVQDGLAIDFAGAMRRKPDPVIDSNKCY
jgi:hypothetical protein